MGLALHNGRNSPDEVLDVYPAVLQVNQYGVESEVHMASNVLGNDPSRPDLSYESITFSGQRWRGVLLRELVARDAETGGHGGGVRPSVRTNLDPRTGQRACGPLGPGPANGSAWTSHLPLHQVGWPLGPRVGRAGPTPGDPAVEAGPPRRAVAYAMSFVEGGHADPRPGEAGPGNRVTGKPGGLQGHPEARHTEVGRTELMTPKGPQPGRRNVSWAGCGTRFE